MRAKDEFYLRRHGGEFSNGREVGGEIGFRAVEPDFAGVVSISGEEQAVGTIDEGDGVGRVAGRRDDFYGAAAEIYFEAVVNWEGNLPGLGGIFRGIEILWERVARGHAELVLGDFGLRVFTGTFGISTSEGGVHPIDERELPVAADVIVVGVRVEYDDGA